MIRSVALAAHESGFTGFATGVYRVTALFCERGEPSVPTTPAEGHLQNETRPSVAQVALAGGPSARGEFGNPSREPTRRKTNQCARMKI